MSKFGPITETARRLIAKNGSVLTLTREEQGTFDPVTGSSATITTTTYNLTAVVLPWNGFPSAKLDIGTKSGELVTANMRQILATSVGLTVTPENGDFVTLEGEKFTVLGNTPINPDQKGAIIHQLAVSK